MKRFLIVVFAAFCSVAALAQGSVEWSGRAPHPAVVNPVCGYPEGTVMSLRGEWWFVKDEYSADRSQFFRRRQEEFEWSDARKIRVPGNWEAQGVGEPVAAQERRTYDGYRRLPLNRYFNGDGWYRLKVKIPSEWRDSRIWLKVGGVGCQGWFWVDGKPVAHVFDYCATRKFEITDLVKPGEVSEITAEVTNGSASKRGYRDSCCIFGGLFRDVELEATPKAFIDDAWVRGDFDGRRAEVRVAIDGRAEGLSLRATVDGETAELPLEPSDTGCELGVALREFRPWSPENPNLYTARVELVSNGRVIQSRTERFGVRKLEVRGKDFRLNGKPFFLRGVGFHEIDPINGQHPADRGFYRERIAKIRACGFNAVRLHTHCESPEFFEAADELGLMVQAELPYYGDHPVAWAPFEPLADAEELYLNFRRHPSFAIYSGGNEGTFGPVLGRRFYDEVKSRDPDRLVLEQTTIGSLQWPGRGHVGTTDFISGPTAIWPRGSVDPELPLLAHEYMNLAIKLDTRLEDRYTGVWGVPMTRAQRDEWLARFGLDRAVGDRLQDAQHALQATWQKRGVESARKDPCCDGYYFWSMLDAVCVNMIGWTGVVDETNLTFMAQGVLNQFFEEKRNGQTMAGFAEFNSPVGVFVDAVPEDLQIRSGDGVSAKVFLANYGGEDLHGAKLAWSVTDGEGNALASGGMSVGEQPQGVVRAVADLKFDAPSVERPTAGRFEVSVGGHANHWPCWIFPKRARRDGRDLAVVGACRGAFEKAYDGVLPESRVREAKIVAADYGSAAAREALARGQSVIEIGGTEGPVNVELGWWFLSDIVGATFDVAHPVLGHWPASPDLSTLHFRIFKKGLRLPVGGFPSAGLIAVSEGVNGCFAHLAERVDAAGGRHLLAYGLAVDAAIPESVALLDGLVDRARQPVTAAERKRLLTAVAAPRANESASSATIRGDGLSGGSGRE